MTNLQLLPFILLICCFGTKVLTLPTAISGPPVPSCNSCYNAADIDEITVTTGDSINVPTGTLTWSMPTPSSTSSHILPTTFSTSQTNVDVFAGETGTIKLARESTSLASNDTATHAPHGHGAAFPHKSQSSKDGFSNSTKTSISLCVGLGAVLFLIFVVFLYRMTAIQANEVRYDRRITYVSNQRDPVLEIPRPTYQNHSRNLPIETSIVILRPYPELPTLADPGIR